MLVSVYLLAGCATTAPEKIVVFPDPPEEPRIAYVRSITGGFDFRKPSIFDAILGTPSGSDFKQPYGVSVSGDKIYIADAPSTVVFVIDTKLEKTGYIGLAKLTGPSAVAVTKDGMVYVSDGPSKKAFVFDQNGALKMTIGKPGDFKNIAGIAVNSELERVYIVDSFSHLVRVYNLRGESQFQFGKRGMDDGEFNFPTHVTIDNKTNNVYIVDTQNFRVQIFDKDGKFLRKFGQLGDIPGTFSRPKGIGIDSEGHVYVVDAAFNNVQVFDQEGHILLGFGEAGSNAGQFALPAGLCVDDKDRIYVVDSLNKRVQVFQFLSDAWKKEHPEEYKRYQSGQTAGIPVKIKEKKIEENTGEDKKK